MVKFSKQFEAQLVPEWKEAFVDYVQLKRDIKKIHIVSDGEGEGEGKNGVTSVLASWFRKCTSLDHDNKPRTIQVHRKLSPSDSRGDLYETEVLEQFSDTDSAAEFFSCLDEQLNKVNKFYRTKEKEFVERGDSMKKQLEILVELKTALNQKQKQAEDVSISGTISCDEESIRDSADSVVDESDSRNSPGSRSLRRMNSLSGTIINCQGKNLRVHIPLTTPTRTFSAITYLLWDDLVNQPSKKVGNRLHINRKKLHHAEKMIRGAFIELYKGLSYLKTYRSLNLLAFVKILKKFDKVTNKQVLPIYLKVVESSYFNSSDKILKLADEVEELFVKHFAQDDKRAAMKYLRPTQRKESHTVTFFTGLFTGCFLAFFVGYVIMAHLTGIYRSNSDHMYMDTVYPVLSLFSLPFLHFFLYGCNIFMWRKTRINYSFIFEVSPTKELKYQDIFLICAISMTVVVGALFLHLFLVAKGYSSSLIQDIPGILLLVFATILVCPFNIIYKPSRYQLLSVLRNIVLSPMYKVAMLDFFMADQLCSQVPMLRNLENIACYYITGSYKSRDNNYCLRNPLYKDVAFAISFIPYYWRAMQCARRWFDEGHKSHLMNFGKYVSAMLAAGAKVAYEKERSIGWLWTLVVMSTAATVYNLYWDFVKDWGLLQFRSKNPWLRDELMLKRKSIYFFSMGLNLLLRLAWLQCVFHFSFQTVDQRITIFFLAALEVVRRGQWNFYRLENEHLNNAGHFRAVKIVPLPFEEVDERSTY